MATLFGQTFTRTQLLQRVGDVSQVGDVCLKTLADGAERGVRVADFSTGSGFRFSVLIDRGMDIGPAEWGGKPLAWQSGVGAVHPAHYDAIGLGWLRSFPGGLMVGCGLDNVGGPNSDEGEDLGRLVEPGLQDPAEQGPPHLSTSDDSKRHGFLLSP